MQYVCVVIGIMSVLGSDPDMSEIGKFKTYQGCNSAVVDNLDKFDQIKIYNLDRDGRPIPDQPSGRSVTYLEGYQPTPYPYFWYDYRRWQKRTFRRHGW